jgi:DNA polymerase-2
MVRRELIEGWLFDAYTEPEGMRVWVLSPDGKARDFLDPWRPGLRLAGTPSQLGEARRLLERRKRRHPVDIRWSAGSDLHSGRAVETLDLRVPVRAHRGLVEELKSLGLPLYDADIHPVQAYHYERGHFPVARCAFEVDAKTNRLLDWELRDDPWALDYALPPLKTLTLALSGSETAGKIDPGHAPRGKLLLTNGGVEHELEGPLEQQLETLARRLREWDPDLIFTEWGDSWLMPQLERWSRKLDRPLPLSRDPRRGVTGGGGPAPLPTAPGAYGAPRGGRSFYTYGRTVYQTGVRYLSGRWHIDLRNSFMHKESGLHGLLEIARTARIPVQRAARSTIGTSLTSMQMHRAFLDGVLIPMEKQQAEDFRPASGLVVADKGGLVYEPETGWHEEVVEYDFTSMYPTLMVDWNISPETVNCPCCPDNKVPEIGHHVCTRREGLIPKVLAPILQKRAAYKKLAKSVSPRAAVYKARADAFKWILVCCFGYLGFKNARFGKIESHECVTACGREVLLRAKEAAEKRGFRMLHALVDSLWLQGGPGVDYEALRLAIEKESGIPIALEGVYKWIRFCPSRTDPGSGVPAKYFGAFKDGSLKVRGLALRRRDTPEILKRLQKRMLERLARVDSLAACERLAPSLRDLIAGTRARIEEGGATAPELAITVNVSKTPDEYHGNSPQAIASKTLASRGLELRRGEQLRFVISSAKDTVKEWRVTPLALLEGPLEIDSGKYVELLERAAWEILEGLATKPPAENKRRLRKKTPGTLLLPLVFRD